MDRKIAPNKKSSSQHCQYKNYNSHQETVTATIPVGKHFLRSEERTRILYTLHKKYIKKTQVVRKIEEGNEGNLLL